MSLPIEQASGALPLTVHVEDWPNDPARQPKRRSRKRLVVEPQRAPDRSPVMTTKHVTRATAETWQEAVSRQGKRVAPDRKPSFAEWFRFYARIGAMQGPTHAMKPDPALDEREVRRGLSALKMRDVQGALNALEASPYVVVYRDGTFQPFARGRDAIGHARSRKGSQVHFVSMTYRPVVGLVQTLMRPDRARGPSSVLAGQGTRFLQHYVATTLTSVRVF